jgi:hypothetical protein
MEIHFTDVISLPSLFSLPWSHPMWAGAQVNRLCFGWQSNKDREGSPVPATLAVVHIGSHNITSLPDEGNRPPLVDAPIMQSQMQLMGGRDVGGAMMARCYMFGAMGKWHC